MGQCASGARAALATAAAVDLQPDFAYSPDQTRASEVALQFSAEGPAATRLEFEHRYLEPHGEGFEKLFASVDSAGGWTMLDKFVEKMKEGIG
jgi:hypothetical protein